MCLPVEINKRICFHSTNCCYCRMSAPLCWTRKNCCYYLLKSQKRWNPMPSIWSLSLFSFFSVTKSSSLRDKTKENCTWLMRMMPSKIVPFGPSHTLIPASSLYLAHLSSSPFSYLSIPWNRPELPVNLVVIYYISSVRSVYHGLLYIQQHSTASFSNYSDSKVLKRPNMCYIF